MNNINISALARDEKIQLAQLLEEKERREIAAIANTKLLRFNPYPWQKKFFAASSTCFQRLLMAANQVGKSDCGAVEVAFHLTGNYPDWWEGKRFEYPILCWSLGVSNESVKGNNQFKLFGEYINREIGFINNGFIGNDLIDFQSIVPSHHEKGLVKELRVRHASGGWSKLAFKTYSQGQHALMGPVVDLIHIDEEPEDPEIYPQCIARTTNGNKGRGGLIILTFTPENGVTLLVDQFLNHIEDGQMLLNVTWDDAPHITPERKKQLLSAIPEYQRDMRSKGIPLMGSGVVFPISEEKIKGEIPGIREHGIPKHYQRWGGIDFAYGGDHYTAVAYLAYSPDDDVIYVYGGFKMKGSTPIETASRMRKFGTWIPIAYPHDGEAVKMSGSGTYKQTAEQYREEDINMMSRSSTFEDGSNGVEAGVTEMFIRFKTGRLKIAPHLEEYFEEHRLYHRKDGKIVKEKDDFICAIRYGIMMRRYAERKPVEEDYSYQIDDNDVGTMGY